MEKASDRRDDSWEAEEVSIGINNWQRSNPRTMDRLKSSNKQCLKAAIDYIIYAVICFFYRLTSKFPWKSSTCIQTTSVDSIARKMSDEMEKPTWVVLLDEETGIGPWTCQLTKIHVVGSLKPQLRICRRRLHGGPALECLTRMTWLIQARMILLSCIILLPNQSWILCLALLKAKSSSRTCLHFRQVDDWPDCLHLGQCSLILPPQNRRGLKNLWSGLSMAMSISIPEGGSPSCRDKYQIEEKTIGRELLSNK